MLIPLSKKAREGVFFLLNSRKRVLVSQISEKAHCSLEERETAEKPRIAWDPNCFPILIIQTAILLAGHKVQRQDHSRKQPPLALGPEWFIKAYYFKDSHPVKDIVTD